MTPTHVSMEELLAEAGWLRRLAGQIARDASSADDLAQGTFVAALEHPPESGRPLRPWLATVIRNLARSGRRTDVRRAERERQAARPESQPAGDELLAKFEEQRNLANLVFELDAPYRGVVLRRYFRGETSAEIARVTGEPAATVRSQLARGLEQLRVAHIRACGGSERRSLSALVIAAGIPSNATPVSAAAGGVVLSTSPKLGLIAAATLLLVAVWYGSQSARPSLGGAARDLQTNELILHAPTATREIVRAVPSRADRRVAIGFADEPYVAIDEIVAVSRTGFSLRAIDKRGVPVAGAQVWLVERNGLPRELEPTARSGANGRLEFDVPSAATFLFAPHEERMATLLLCGPGCAARIWTEEVLRGSVTELGDQALASGASASGRVLSPAGSPLPNVELVALVGVQSLDSVLGGRTGSDRGLARWGMRARPCVAVREATGRLCSMA